LPDLAILSRVSHPASPRNSLFLSLSVIIIVIVIMSTSLKPRHHGLDPEAEVASTNSKDEKEEKIQRRDGDKFRQWIMFFVLLSVAGLILGSKQPKPKTPDVAGNRPQQVQFAAQEEESQEEKAPKTLEKTEPELVTLVDTMDEKVRTYKKNLKPDSFMETDPTALKLTKELQQLTQTLTLKRYGTDKFRVLIDLVFPESIPDYSESTKTGQLILEMAPTDLIPCSVYNFLEVARTWKSGSFHRNANHVLQVQAHSSVRQGMPFQEYSPLFPHEKGTVGYAGRPSGPAWYVSILDNTKNHGPGSQQKHNPNEADSNFGKVIQGMDDVVPRIHSVPQKSWLDVQNRIAITKMTILIPDANVPNRWIPWNSATTTTA
jgi:hypothetical protein